MTPTRTASTPDELRAVLAWAADMGRRGLQRGAVTVTLGRPKRTTDQNSKLWAMLGDVSKQVEWHGLKLTPTDWKEMFSAALKKQRAVPGLDGSSFVVLGASTSRMNKQEFSDLLETIYAFGAEKGVTWSEPAQEESHG